MEDTTAEDDKEEEIKGDDEKEEDSQDGDEVRPLAQSSSSNPGKTDCSVMIKQHS